MSERPIEGEGAITEAGSEFQPEFLQGPTSPAEVAGQGEILAGQLSFDDWLAHVPREVRARAYDSIAVALVTQPTLVEDYMVEILGEGYFRDPDVFQGAALWINQPESAWRGERGWDQRFELWMMRDEESVLAELPDRPANATRPDRRGIDRFIDFVAEGDPDIGIEGDPTLRGFVRGGSGWDVFKYPLAYGDRKDFLPFLSVLPNFAVGTALVGVGMKAVSAVRGAPAIAPGSNKLGQAMLGATQPAQFVRTVSGILFKPVSWTVNMFQKIGNIRGARPAALGLTTVATGYGIHMLNLFGELGDPRQLQEIQTATITSFQEALTEQDWDEAQVIYEVGLAQGLDMSDAGIDVETGQQFTYETESGVETGVEVRGTNGEIVTFGGSEEPSAAGTIVSLPGHLAATFGKSGVIGTETLTMVEGYDDLGLPGPAPLLGAQGEVPLIDETYRANRWFPKPETGRDQLEWELNQLHGTPDPDKYFRAPGQLYQTESVTPIFRGGDTVKYLNSLHPLALVATQVMMINAGYLSPEGTINGVNYQPGLIDAKTRRGMREVMVDANINGYHDIGKYLAVAAATGESHRPGGGGSGFRRAPFERRAYLAPDYDTLTQYVKGVAGQHIGRKLNDSELVLMADKMGVDHRANFDVEEKARRAQYDAAGRGGDPGFAGELVDMEASFKEFFEEKYETEIERRDTVDEVYASTQNFFGSLDNAARLIGR